MLPVLAPVKLDQGFRAAGGAEIHGMLAACHSLPGALHSDSRVRVAKVEGDRTLLLLGFVLQLSPLRKLLSLALRLKKSCGSCFCRPEGVTE